MSESPVNHIEAVLFASGAPVSLEKLLQIFPYTEAEMHRFLDELDSKYADMSSGIALICINGAYQLCTKANSAEYVKKALEVRKTPPLSKASLEVLAIIAYNQPVTRSFVEQVRGIDSSYIVNSLAEKGLICETDRLDAPGHPALFSTTDAFLRCFGLSSIEMLPEFTPETLTDSNESTQP